MKFNQKTVRSVLVLVVIISTLVITGVAIYFFGFQAIKGNDSNQEKIIQPIFNQNEINWISKEKSLILARFQQVLETKRPQTKFSYAVDNLNAPTIIKVSYFFDQQMIKWFYELEY